MRDLSALLILALATVLPANIASAGSAKDLLPGDHAPAFQIDNWLQKGTYDRVQPANGRLITVIEFWADWCPLSRTVLPIHDRIQAKLKDKGIRFIAVAEGGLDEVQAVASQLKLRNIAVTYDKDEKIFNAFVGDDTRIPIPFAVIVEETGEHKHGRILWKGPAVANDPPAVSQSFPAPGIDDAISRIVSAKFDLSRERALEQDKADMQWLIAKMLDFYSSRNPGEMKALADHTLSRKWPEEYKQALCLPILQAASALLDAKDASKEYLADGLNLAQTAIKMGCEDYACAVSVYAMALYENGDVKGAVEAQQRALGLRMDFTSEKECQEALAKYQAALSGKDTPNTESEKTTQAETDKKTPVSSITAEQAASDLTALHNYLRLNYAAYDDIAWRFAAQGSSWDKHNAAFLDKIRARQDWPLCDYFDLLLEYLNVVRDCHLYIQGTFSRGGDPRPEQSHPTIPSAPFFTGIRVREQGGRMTLVQVPENLSAISGEVLEGVPVIGSPTTARAGQAYLFPTLPIQSPDSKEYLLGAFAAIHSKPGPIKVSLTSPSTESGLVRQEIELPIHPGHMPYTWDPKAAAWSLDLKPIPLLTVRRLWGDGLDGLPQTATTLRDLPTVILDIHNNGGGSDTWAMQWCSKFSEQNYLAYLGMAELCRGETDPLRRWNSVARLVKLSASGDSGAPTGGRPYSGKLFVVTGKACGSAGETLADLASQVPGAVLVGENTVGAVTYGNMDQVFTLPHADITVHFSRSKFAMGKKPACEGVGMFPDYWLDDADPVAAITAYCSLK